MNKTTAILLYTCVTVLAISSTTGCLSKSRRTPPLPTATTTATATATAATATAVTSPVARVSTSGTPDPAPTATKAASSQAAATPTVGSTASAPQSAAPATPTTLPPASTSTTVPQTSVATPASTATEAAGTATTPPSTATVQATVPPTATVFNIPFINLSADSLALDEGECTTLRWNSGYIDELLLNNQPVVGTGQQQVCPTTDTEYVLLARDENGEFFDDLYVVVTPAEPLPAFGIVAVSKVSLNACDSTDGVTVWVDVYNDPTSVTLLGERQDAVGTNELPMSLDSGNTWVQTIVSGGKQESGTLLLSFRAVNNAGSAESGVVSSLGIVGC